MSTEQREQLEAERELLLDLIGTLDTAIYYADWWIKNSETPLEKLNPQPK